MIKAPMIGMASGRRSARSKIAAWAIAGGRQAHNYDRPRGGCQHCQRCREADPDRESEPGAKMGFGLKCRLVHGCTLVGGWRTGG